LRHGAAPSSTSPPCPPSTARWSAPAAYAASKGAVLALTRAWASYGRDGIRVNAICPERIRTRLTADIVERVERAAKEGHGIPLGRVGEARGHRAVRALPRSDDASFISGAANRRRRRRDGGVA